MCQYQSFPEKPGDSNSQAKLASLALPPLAGKSFLDIGCNEGYFCGYAFFDAASQVIGLDKNPDFLEKARRRFPQCVFKQADWSDLAATLGADNKFDVILCASALHYAEDQAGLLEALMRRLKPGGILVLEIGVIENIQPEICEDAGGGWHWVKRSIDRRLFPTQPALEKMLSPYAWKHMGKSVSQTGDPLARHVIHASNPLPLAILLMGAPGSGKSTVARKLSGALKVLGGDRLLACPRDLPEKYARLRDLASELTSWQRIDLFVRKIFQSGAWKEYVRLITDTAGENDFIFDGFIPENNQLEFQRELESLGYRVMRLLTPAPEFTPNELSRRGRVEARKYQLFLGAMSILEKRKR